VRPARLAIFLAAALCACTTSPHPYPSDTVKTEAAAIAIAVAKCFNGKAPAEPLHARLRNRTWRVWQPALGADSFTLDIDATDGEPENCIEKVSSIG
jgi:hypothetical protein